MSLNLNNAHQLMTDFVKIKSLFDRGFVVEQIDEDAMRFDLRYKVYDKIGIDAKEVKINEDAEVIQ